MALSEQNIDVPLSVVDQKLPKTGGMVGTLSRLLDCQVTKYQGAPGAPPNLVRVDKRDAFATLSDVVRDSATGAVIGGATLDNQTLLTEFANQALLVSNDKTHVYSGITQAWQRHDYQLPTHALKQGFVHTSNSVASTPDTAQIQGVTCHTWNTVAWFDTGGGTPQELPGVYFRIVDFNGVVLRADTLLSTTDTRIKVVSDGSHFWIFSEKGDGTGSFTITLLDTHGVTVATATTACTYTSGSYWDVVAASWGPTLAQATGVNTQFTKYGWSGTTITQTSVVDNSIAGGAKLGWLTNLADPTNAYLATSEHVGANNNTIHAYRIPAALTQNHAYAVATGVVDEVANLTGYVVNATGDIVVAYSVINPTGTNYLTNNMHSASVTFAGVTTALQTAYMNLASRAFKLGQSYYAICYYPSNAAQVSATTVIPNQPTYFLVPLSSTTQRTAGRWDYGAAYCDWQTPASPFNFALASVVGAFPTGMHTALSYRAESVTTSTLIEAPTRFGHAVFTPYNRTGVVTTVGIKSYLFGDPGTAVEFNGELLLPGPGASVWSGQEFSEHGIALAFEQPTLTLQASGGGFAALTPGAYQVVVVGEWTDTNGRRVRSRPSPPTNVTVGASQYIQVAGYMNHATNKKDLLISIYSTAMVPDSGGGFVPTTLHYKITFDVLVGAAAPLYNDNLGTTWSYNHTFSAITANEILYTDKGQLENYPAPPFSRGCVWRDRVFLVGPDNALWFSSEPTEGDALWFHPAFRMVLPTNDEITSVSATTEGYLLVQCAAAQWYFPSVTFPGADGQGGSIPNAVELKFNMGCTGQALATKLGCVYASSAGGLWLVTRDLQNVWLSEPLADTLSGDVSALAIDSRQRIYAFSTPFIGVYDLVSQCWYEWRPPAPVILLSTYLGAVTFGDGTLVWQQALGSFVDSKTVAGVTTALPVLQGVKLNSLHFGGVRNFASLLEMQLVGDTYTASTVEMDLSFDDDDGVVESTTWATDPTVPFEYSYGPANQLCSAVGIELTESLAAGQVAGQGFSIEALALTVGLYQGQNRLPDNRRI